jgi:tetratricopeptide (TPR) repeat protein
LACVATLKKPRLQRLAGAVFALLIALFSNGAHANDFKLDAQQIAYYQSGTENARVRLLIELTHNGHADMAEALLKRFPLEGPLAENRKLFIDGLILESRGELKAAVAKFRAALANDPKLTLVRSELAQVLARMDETDSAKHHLELLAADAPTPAQAAGIRSFIQQLDADHPLKFSGFVSIAPSTNINLGSSHQKVYTPGLGGIYGSDASWDIDPASQKQSGTGLTAGANVGFSHRLGDHFQGVLAAGAAGTYYPVVAATTLGLSQSAELRYLFQDNYLGLGGVSSQSLDPINYNIAYSSFGPHPSLQLMLTPRDQLTGSATYEWRSYPSNSTANGNALLVYSILTHAFDSSSNVALILGYENVTQQIDFNSYYDGTVGLGFYKELPKGITLEGQGTARFAGFDAVNPLALTTRYDENYTGSLTFTKRDWNIYGFAPSVNFLYTRNFSNIDVYDYDSQAVDFRLTKNF